MDISPPQPATASQTQSKNRIEYYSYVRRLPSKRHCDILFQRFFADINPINSPLDGSIFEEQLQRWWDLAYSKLLKGGLDELPEDIRCFPALIFQVLAVTLQFLPRSDETTIDELKFGPSQTIMELSKEYSDCGVSLAKIVGKARLSLVGVQHGSMRLWWLISIGNLMQAWAYTGQIVK